MRRPGPPDDDPPLTYRSTSHWQQRSPSRLTVKIPLPPPAPELFLGCWFFLSPRSHCVSPSLPCLQMAHSHPLVSELGAEPTSLPSWGRPQCPSTHTHPTPATWGQAWCGLTPRSGLQCPLVFLPESLCFPVPNEVQTPSRHHQHMHTRTHTHICTCVSHTCTRGAHTLALPADEEMRSFFSRSWVHTCPRWLCGSSLWTTHHMGISCSCSALTAAQDKRHRPTFCFTPSLLSFWLERFRGSFWIPIRINFLTFAKWFSVPSHLSNSQCLYFPPDQLNQDLWKWNSETRGILFCSVFFTATKWV